ncbi:MAG TPA: hypothetical protein VEP90_09180 [Methylomirabilota bacterium]|nr:hypothetical protein [Methylomirabilota bacterium]
MPNALDLKPVLLLNLKPLAHSPPRIDLTHSVDPHSSFTSDSDSDASHNSTPIA